jgi:hypothetical protein
MLEGKAVARGLCRAFPAQNYVQIIMIELVAIKEPNDLGLRPEEHIAIEPAERKRIATGRMCLDPPGTVGNALSERAKRLGDLHGDRPGLVVAQTLEMRPRSVAQRLHLEPVSRRAREIGEHGPQPRGRKAVQRRMNPHLLAMNANAPAVVI